MLSTSSTKLLFSCRGWVSSVFEVIWTLSSYSLSSLWQVAHKHAILSSSMLSVELRLTSPKPLISVSILGPCAMCQHHEARPSQAQDYLLACNKVGICPRHTCGRRGRYDKPKKGYSSRIPRKFVHLSEATSEWTPSAA